MGCAIVVNEKEHSWTLSPQASIFTAEKYAIWQALRYCEMTADVGYFLIASDSQAALKSLLNRMSGDELTRMCLEVVKVLHTRGTRISFLWIPGHVGIEGNDRADGAARRAAAKEEIDVPLILTSDRMALIAELAMNEWQQIWEHSETHLSDIKPSVTSLRPLLYLPRRENVIFHRLRLGHTALTHDFIFRREEPPVCISCNIRLTVKHIICDCPKFNVARNMYKLPNRIRECLTEPEMVNNTFLFLKSTGLYLRI